MFRNNGLNFRDYTATKSCPQLPDNNLNILDESGNLKLIAVPWEKDEKEIKEKSILNLARLAATPEKEKVVEFDQKKIEDAQKSFNGKTENNSANSSNLESKKIKRKC